MNPVSDKEAQELYSAHAKKRITLIKRTKNERSQIKKVLRGDGFTDVVDFDEFEEAWEKLQLSTTYILVYSVARQEGLDFLQNLIDSTRFKKTPMLIFTNKPGEHPTLFANADITAFWSKAPMNALKVEQALTRALKHGVVEKNHISDESAALEYFPRAMDAIAEGRYEEARELLRLTLKDSPNFFEAYLKMVETLIALGEFNAAGRVLERAASMKKEDPAVSLLQAKMAAEMGPKEKAIEMFNDVVSRHPGNFMFMIEIGNIALDKGWIGEAIHFYEMAKNIDPGLIHVYNRLGIAYSRTGEFNDALKMYERSLKIDDSDAGIHFNIGMTHHRKGDDATALASFKKSSELDPEMVEPKKWIERIEAR